MSKRLSATGKAFFLLRTGARIWVEVFLIFCTIYSAEEKFIWKFLYAFPAVYTMSSCTLVGKAAHSPAQSCHQHPSGTRASEVLEFGNSFFLLPPAGRKLCWHLSPAHLSLQAGKPRDAGDRYEGKTHPCSSLNFCLHCISEKGKNRDFCFPTPDFLSPFCCSHWHCANARIHIHHLKGS